MADFENAYTDLTNDIHAAYRAQTPASAAFHERAAKALVGGVSGTVRYFRPYPLYMQSGNGSHTVDLDGNDYVDHFLCGACLLLGHRNPEIMQAIAKTPETGSLLLNDKLSVDLAELIQKMVPCAERVRLLNSGTEAVMSALRFARAYTGKSKVVKFYGTYHGQGDEMLFGLNDKPKRLGGGITEEAVSQTAMAHFGDFEALADILKQGEVAAVLVDPSMHHCGLWVGTNQTYAQIKQMAHDAGAVLIFDEVISGFRIAAGGAQSYFDITPDLAIFGKAFAAGEKIGAVVGREEIMAVADPARSRPGPFAYQSGTGNDVRNSVTAALAALKTYQRFDQNGGYQRVSDLADKLGSGLQKTFADHGIACHFNQLGPMVRLFITDGPHTYEHCTKLDPRIINLFHLALLTEGVLTIPGSNDFFLSFAHTNDDINLVIAAAGQVLDKFDFKTIT